MQRHIGQRRVGLLESPALKKHGDEDGDKKADKEGDFEITHGVTAHLARKGGWAQRGIGAGRGLEMGAEEDLKAMLDLVGDVDGIAARYPAFTKDQIIALVIARELRRIGGHLEAIARRTGANDVTAAY